MTLDFIIDTLEKLAATQRNLPVPLTEEEHTALRLAAQVLRYDWLREPLEDE